MQGQKNVCGSTANFNDLEFIWGICNLDISAPFGSTQVVWLELTPDWTRTEEIQRWRRYASHASSEQALYYCMTVTCDRDKVLGSANQVFPGLLAFIQWQLPKPDMRLS